jgi:hypothetical protein
MITIGNDNRINRRAAESEIDSRAATSRALINLES